MATSEKKIAAVLLARQVLARAFVFAVNGVRHNRHWNRRAFRVIGKEVGGDGKEVPQRFVFLSRREPPCVCVLNVRMHRWSKHCGEERAHYPRLLTSKQRDEQRVALRVLFRVRRVANVVGGVYLLQLGGHKEAENGGGRLGDGSAERGASNAAANGHIPKSNNDELVPALEQPIKAFDHQIVICEIAHRFLNDSLRE